MSSKGGHLATQRMPPPLLFKGYCSKLSIKFKIQDGARRALGGLKGCRCVFLGIYNYVKEILYMWIKGMAWTCGTECLSLTNCAGRMRSSACSVKTF